MVQGQGKRGGAGASVAVPLASLAEGEGFDLVVLGAGGAGLSAAVFGAIAGARVLMVEATGLVGGTTAYSAGTTWVPGTPVGAAVNPQDTPAAALAFLDGCVGDLAPRALREAFVRHGAEAVATIQAGSRLQYRARPVHPDYLSEVPGSTTAGRALEPQAFDGRLLGDDFHLLRPPIPEFTVLGGMMVDRDDIVALLGWRRSAAAFGHALRVLGRHVLDRVTHPRGTRLLMGNALVGRLLLSVKERGVPLLLHTTATALHRGADGRIDRLTLRQANGPDGAAAAVERTISVRRGVVLAGGGFNRHPRLRAQRLPGVPADWCPGAPGHTGGLTELALGLGAQLGPTGQSDAFWAPVSLRRRHDGSTAVFPHFVFDRPKPHLVTLDAQGARFLNESTSYHLFGQAMQRVQRERAARGADAAACIPAWLVTDRIGIERYGLGMVRPRGMGLQAALDEGYVLRGLSLADLATRTGMDLDTLQATLQRFNAAARAGEDADFQRGSTAYQRANGDATAGFPNPCLGPVEQAPFYALKLHPGDIGAATGLVTDTAARVLDAQQRPIPGLYAVGNEQHSVMGGVYPGPGITIGPGLVFAHLAVRDALGAGA